MFSCEGHLRYNLQGNLVLFEPHNPSLYKSSKNKKINRSACTILCKNLDCACVSPLNCCANLMLEFSFDRSVYLLMAKRVQVKHIP